MVDSASDPQSNLSENNHPQQANSTEYFDYRSFIAKLRAVIKDPQGCWQEFKSESLSEYQVLSGYLIPAIAITVFFGFFRAAFIGYKPIADLDIYTRTPFFAALLTYLLLFFCKLASVYVGAVVAEKYAPKFEGKVGRVDALKLLSYSYLPLSLISVCELLPVATLQWFIGLAAGVYTIYLVYEGISPMTGVPKERRLGYLGLIVGSILLSYMAIYYICAYPII